MAIDGQFGGRLIFEFAGLRIPPCDGEFTIDPSNMASSAMANQDGSAAFSLKPKLPGMDIKLRNAARIDWATIVLKQGNCTVKEENNGRSHLWTGCRLVGDPKVNLATGEVDGLRIEGPRYQVVG